MLLYADIGMESFTYYMAFSRLAPVQAVTHGHPCTTGLPELDYFVRYARVYSYALSMRPYPIYHSFKDYEPQSNQKFYTEKLALLNGQSSPYLPPDAPAVLNNRSHYNFTEEDHVYMIPQSIFKFHPDYDEVLMKLLQRDPVVSLL